MLTSLGHALIQKKIINASTDSAMLQPVYKHLINYNTRRDNTV